MMRVAKRRAGSFTILIALAMLALALLLGLWSSSRDVQLCLARCMSHSVACTTLRQSTAQSRDLQRACEAHRATCRELCR